jgi:tRNA G18 (ribose-2'-O)-methylase SpoU
MRGFFGIGIYHTKTETNVGTLIRSAHSFGAGFVFTIGRRYKKQGSAINRDRHIPIFHFKTVLEWKKTMPSNARLICVELHEKAISIKHFQHPQQAIYILGAEDYGIPKKMLKGCQIVQLPGKYCLNVATAGSIIMYDRINKIERL